MKVDPLGTPVYVEWVDSRGCSSSWREWDDLKEHGVCVVRSVGWLLRDDKDLIVVVPHIGTDPDQGCGEMTIPRSQVTKIRRLK